MLHINTVLLLIALFVITVLVCVCMCVCVCLCVCVCVYVCVCLFVGTAEKGSYIDRKLSSCLEPMHLYCCTNLNPMQLHQCTYVPMHLCTYDAIAATAAFCALLLCCTRE
jgi:hypothetical protein